MHDEKDAIKAGACADEIRPDEPNRARQKDVNARWTVKQRKATVPGPVFAEPKGGMELMLPTIGIARVEATVTLANMAFNTKRWVFLDARTLPA